ncbi:hypothetical protein J6590_067307, partial [Homalodisca vitripennis]
RDVRWLLPRICLMEAFQLLLWRNYKRQIWPNQVYGSALQELPAAPNRKDTESVNCWVEFGEHAPT